MLLRYFVLKTCTSIVLALMFLYLKTTKEISFFIKKKEENKLRKHIIINYQYGKKLKNNYIATTKYIYWGSTDSIQIHETQFSRTRDKCISGYSKNNNNEL